MDSPVIFRPIHPGDEPFLYEVYASTRAEELAPVPWTAAQREEFLRMQFAAQHKHYQEHYSSARFLILLQNDQPIGRLYVDRGQEEICIVDISLLPEYRRQGIGSWLLREILAEAAQAAKPVRIHVEQFNPALRLYERLGFKKIADVGVYFHMEWSPTSLGK